MTRGIRDPIPGDSIIGRIGSTSGAPGPISLTSLVQRIMQLIPGGTSSALTPIANGDVLANISGVNAAPVGVTVSALLDALFGSTQGDILYRDTSAWKALAPGTGWLHNNGTTLAYTTPTASDVGAPSGSGSSTGTNTGDQTNISGNAATATNVAVGGITGAGSGVLTFLATPSSANLASALTDELGSGNAVFGSKTTGGTVTLVSSGGGVPTYSAQSIDSTILGDRVLFNIRIVLTGLGTLAAGNLSISGLPQTAAATAVYSFDATNLAATATTALVATTASGGSTIALSKFAAGARSSLTVADITGTAVINISGQYRF